MTPSLGTLEKNIDAQSVVDRQSGVVLRRFDRVPIAPLPDNRLTHIQCVISNRTIDRRFLRGVNILPVSFHTSFEKFTQFRPFFFLFYVSFTNFLSKIFLYVK